MEPHYLLDNNVLGRLSENQRQSEFVHNYCWIPEEVLHEARWLPDITRLATRAYPTTISVLDMLRVVMEHVPVDDVKLIDLYHNRGNADPLLVACALDAIREQSQFLLGRPWVIVTEDRAVREIAGRLGIDVISHADLLALIESR